MKDCNFETMRSDRFRKFKNISADVKFAAVGVQHYHNCLAILRLRD